MNRNQIHIQNQNNKNNILSDSQNSDHGKIRISMNGQNSGQSTWNNNSIQIHTPEDRIQNKEQNNNQNNGQYKLQNREQINIQNNGQNNGQYKLQTRGGISIQNNGNDNPQDKTRTDIQNDGHYKLHNNGQYKSRDGGHTNMHNDGQYRLQINGNQNTGQHRLQNNGNQNNSQYKLQINDQINTQVQNGGQKNQTNNSKSDMENNINAGEIGSRDGAQNGGVALGQNKYIDCSAVVYERPRITYTDTLTKKEIIEYLQDFEKVVDIEKVKIGSYISYIDIGGEYPSFRLGGTIVVNKPEYLVLNGGRASFSVQKGEKIYFRRLNHTELRGEMQKTVDKYIKDIEKKEDDINKFKLEIDNLNKEIAYLKSILNRR